MNRGSFIAAVLACVLATGALAQTETANLTITDAWARATSSPTANAAVYLTITAASSADTLTGAGTPVAASASLHESSMENGIMRMRAVPGLDVSPGHPAKLAPGGYHLMLTGMKQQLQAGENFPLTLTFKQAGAVQATVHVALPGAMPGMAMGGMGR